MTEHLETSSALWPRVLAAASGAESVGDARDMICNLPDPRSALLDLFLDAVAAVRARPAKTGAAGGGGCGAAPAPPAETYLG